MTKSKGRSNSASAFYLHDKSRRANLTAWDPWPVKGVSPRKNPILSAARAMIQVVNSSDFDHCLDPITLLPASNGISCRQEKVNLYSIRSPSTLPFKVNLWMVGESKIMLRRGCQLVPLQDFLTSFKIRSWESLDKAKLWKLLLADKAKLRELHIPERVHEELYRRWWLLNGFPFRELPGELRNVILSMVLERLPRVYSPGHCDGVCRSGDDGQDKPCFKYHPLPPTNLYLVNKQTNQETKYLIFRRTTFEFKHRFQLTRSLESMTQRNHAALRFVSLKLTTNRFLMLFDAKLCALSHPSFDEVHEFIDGKCRPLGRRRPPTCLLNLVNLETLEIVFPHRRGRRCNDFFASCQRAICWVIFAAIYEYIWPGLKVILEGAIKDDQKDCFRKILDRKEPIRLLEALPESEHFDTMGVISCRRSSCHCNSTCVPWFDKAYHPEDRIPS
ncbi:MAG: hypothetical protein Q9187_003156 [Circinaria calcarea]